nr:MAG TPA: hypothetical protein [Caudoviricetes sp.]
MHMWRTLVYFAFIIGINDRHSHQSFKTIG